MMFHRLSLLLIPLTFFPLVSSSSSFYDIKSKQDINWWCNITPHPDVCKHFMGPAFPRSRPDCRSEFRSLTVKIAMEQMHQAQKYVHNLRHHLRNKNRKVVWKDCSQLLENTILQLNRTLQGFQKNDTSDFDSQTWLSSALTDLETCRSASKELKVPQFVAYIFSGNISKLLSNSLAVNGVLLQDDDTYPKGLPGWVSKSDRKLLETSALSSSANAVVATDGSGNFKSVQAAINYAVSRRRRNGRVVIYVKRGVYRENILVSSGVDNVMLVGDGLRSTVITGSRSVAGGYTTYSAATLGVDGSGFIARGITFRNTAGPQNGQAPALRSASDLSVFHSCGFEGYQDTVFVQSQRQFFKGCYIYGTIDFIFGNAAVVFQNCMIYVRRPLHGQVNVITAQGRTDPFQNTGITIHRSRIMPARDLRPVVASVRTYLGRPWMAYSRTVILKSYMDGFVNPAGWLPWEKSDFALNTLYYGEYHNKGPGASTARRVRWKGFHVIKQAKSASRFTVGKLIAGNAWLPSTGVPFVTGI